MEYDPNDRMSETYVMTLPNGNVVFTRNFKRAVPLECGIVKMRVVAHLLDTPQDPAARDWRVTFPMLNPGFMAMFVFARWFEDWNMSMDNIGEHMQSGREVQVAIPEFVLDLIRHGIVVDEFVSDDKRQGGLASYAAPVAAVFADGRWVEPTAVSISDRPRNLSPAELLVNRDGLRAIDANW